MNAAGWGLNPWPAAHLLWRCVEWFAIPSLQQPISISLSTHRQIYLHWPKRVCAQKSPFSTICLSGKLANNV